MNGDNKHIHNVWWAWEARIDNDNGNVVVILKEFHPDEIEVGLISRRKKASDTEYIFPVIAQEDIAEILRRYPCNGIYQQPAREGLMRAEFDATIERLHQELKPERWNATIFANSCHEISPRFADTFQNLAELFAAMQACRSAGNYCNYYGGGLDDKGFDLREEILRHRLDSIGNPDKRQELLELFAYDPSMLKHLVITLWPIRRSRNNPAESA